MKRIMAILALIIAAAPLFAQESPVAEPNNTEEKSAVEKWEDGNPQIETALGGFTIGGYASIMHKTIDKYNGGDSTNYFDAIRIVTHLQWEILDWLYYSMEVEFEGGGSQADFLTNNYILVEYAEAHATVLDEFNLKAGLLLIPFGRYNLEHDDINWDLMDRPYTVRRVAASAFDQPGIGFYGTFNQVPMFGFGYDVQITQGFDDNFTNNSGSRSARQSFREDNNDNKAIWARFSISPQFDEMGIGFMTGDLGLSTGYQKISPTNGESTRHLGIDGKFKFKQMFDLVSVDITGEWNRIWINRDSDINTPNGLGGYYVDVLFKFDVFPDEWKNDIFGRNPYVGLIVRVEETDLNDDFVGTAARDDRIGVTAGISFRPLNKLVVRAEFKHQQSKKRDDGDETRLVLSVSIGF